MPRDEKAAAALNQRAADRGDVTAKRYLVRKSRETARFSSFDDAESALDPEAGYDVQFVMDPMALRGKILALRLTVLGALGFRKYCYACLSLSEAVEESIPAGAAELFLTATAGAVRGIP